MSFVIDCSVTVGWFMHAQATPYSVAISTHLSGSRRGKVWAPMLWCIELANVLRTACRRQKLDVARAQEILAGAMRLPIRLDETSTRPTDLLALSLRYDLTSYDATYLDLALRLQLPLATQDAALREAALASGVGIWMPA